MKNLFQQIFGAKAPIAPVPSGPARGWASVWVGDFTDELSLDGYLGPGFRRDHGCLPHDASEYDVRPKAVPLADLLSRSSLFASWGEPLLAVAAKAGVVSASCSLVYLHYRHAQAAPVRSPLRFVGSVPFAVRSG